jgi:ABC-type transporter Mla subunit MlaD
VLFRSLKKLALEEALRDKYSSELEAYAKAEAELYVNRVKLVEATSKAEAAEKTYYDVFARMGELYREAQEAAEAYNEENYTFIDAAGFLSGEYYELQNSLERLNYEQIIAADEVYTVEKAIKKGTETLNEYAPAVDEAAAAMQLFEEEQAKTAEGSPAVVDALAEQAEAIGTTKAELEAIAENYNLTSEAVANMVEQSGLSFDEWVQKQEEFAQATTDAIDKVVNDFARAATDIAPSLDEMIAAANENAANWARYTELMGSLSSGMSEEVRKYFNEMGVGALNTLEELNSGGKEAMDNLNAAVSSSTKIGTDEAKRLWNDAGLPDTVGDVFTEAEQNVDTGTSDIDDTITKGAQEAVDHFEKEFDKVIDKTKTALQNLKSTVTSTMSDMPSQMTNIGSQMVDGMISGLNSRSSALYSTVSSIVNSAIARAKAAAATASPSKKTIEIFENVGEGMIVGIERKKQEIQDAMQSVVDNALSVKTDAGVSKAISQIDDTLPSAEDVTKSGGQSGGNTEIENNFIIEHMEVRDDSDVERIAQVLYRKQRRASRGKGQITV